MIFKEITTGIMDGLDTWIPRLANQPERIIMDRLNSQGRSIRMILGHMVDSASNNTHRIVHLQYRESPMEFPNYATHGNNDRWIAIQNYQQENWTNLLLLWKFIHLHLIHVIENVNPEKLDKEWISGSGNITLTEMIVDFLQHFNLHLNEIQELLTQQKH